ncbi:MAG TPA: carbonate dehydratase [Terrimicrobiaceae bacterium]|jgi:carbonic anhydrase|nr:carbonate dehydratase [Terrimicrobiaceae bacterium]
MSLDHLFESNREWANRMTAADPDFFNRLVGVQSPKYLWIGCSDSRVPANEILGLKPGEVFVHRNVANVVNHTDFNSLSVIQYAVSVLKVEHIMVVGHYGCGGVRAALLDQELGLIDNWLRHVRSIYRRTADRFEGLSLEEKEDLLCELNVLDQTRHVEETSFVRNAWKQGQHLELHSWVYRLSDGLLRDLGFVPRSENNSH